MRAIRRGEVWLADLGSTRGREQSGERPVLIVSPDPINQGPAGLVIAVPFTTRRRAIPTHVEVRPPDGGLRELSFAMCEQVRSLAVERLGPHPFGSVPTAVLDSVALHLRLLLFL
ncbi:MAG TPA: type II toxin-antitoxin system PemK/MazF family toxin [Actinomycetes bacterium]|nr:type II toxin-antitoxin system PemK/MazF family toxin [Actinomycetes bacterium]